MGGRRETIVECNDTQRILETGFRVTAVLDNKPLPVKGCILKVSKDRQDLVLKGPGGISISKKLKLFRFCVRGWKATAFTAKLKALRPKETECMTLVYEDGFDGYQATLKNNQVHSTDPLLPLSPAHPRLRTLTRSTWLKTRRICSPAYLLLLIPHPTFLAQKFLMLRPNLEPATIRGVGQTSVTCLLASSASCIRITLSTGISLATPVRSGRALSYVQL